MSTSYSRLIFFTKKIAILISDTIVWIYKTGIIQHVLFCVQLLFLSIISRRFTYAVVCSSELQYSMAWCENATISLSVLLLINIWIFLILGYNEQSFSTTSQNNRKTWYLKWEMVSAHATVPAEQLDSEVRNYGKSAAAAAAKSPQNRNPQTFRSRPLTTLKNY